MNEIKFVTNYNDWQGLYVDGVLVLQDHRLDPDDVLEALNIKYEEIDAGDYLEEAGSLPKLFSDLMNGS